MDYDDLVDQFIVNDDNSDNRETEEASSFEENKTEADNINSNSSSNTSQTCDNSSNYDELKKIHLKTLINSRLISLRNAQLNRVKERNAIFERKRREIVNQSGNGGGGSGSGGSSGGPVNPQNCEKRWKILKGFEGVDGKESFGVESTDSTTTANVTDSTTDSATTTATATDSATNTNTNTNTKTTNTKTELIPCRLELDFEGYKLSDVFLLSPATDLETINLISQQVCQDYDVPVDPFQGAISRCLKDQLEEWQVFQGALEGMKDALPFDEIGPVPLKLDIIVGLHRLEDQLEVNLDFNASNTEIMLKFVSDLRTPDDRILPESEYYAFKPLILHNILEQLMLWRKAIVFGGYHRDPRSNNLKFHDGDVAVLLNDAIAAPFSSTRRHFAHTNTFTPILSTLTIEELEKIESGRERESRRRRRTGATSTIPTGTTVGSKRAAVTTTNSTIINNLTGTVRSPPRTLPTPSSYRGSLHRIQTTNNSDDEGGSTGGPKKRGRKSRL